MNGGWQYRLRPTESSGQRGAPTVLALPDGARRMAISARPPDDPVVRDVCRTPRRHIDAVGHRERGREVGATVADHERDAPCLVAEVHEEVAGLLGGPVPGWMPRDAEDADPPGRVLDHGQDVGLGAVEQAAVKKPHARIASAWERRNCGQIGPVRRGAGPMPLALRISHTVDAATLTPRPASSPWILRYPPPGFSLASRRTRALMSRRVAGRPVLPRLNLAAQRHRTMSRCQRRIVSGVTSSRSP